MGNVMKQLRKYEILRGIVYIIFGFLIINDPRGVFQLTVYLISAYVAIMGIVNVYEGWKIRNQTGAYGLSFLGGLVQVIFAVIILVFSKGLVSMLPIFLGFLILVGGMIYGMQALNLRNYVNVKWVPMLIYSAILIFLGFVLLFNPFSSVLVMFRLFGWILIFMGVGAILTYIQLRNIR